MPGNNVLLTSLVEATPPADISMFPQTIGWQVLLVILILISIYFIYKKIDAWKRNRYRRDALKRLSTLMSLTNLQAIQQLNRILKETARIAFGEKKVARLYGDEWIIFLDKTSVNSFNSEVVKQWQSAIYDPHGSLSINEEMVKQLITLSGLWIQQHEVSS